MPLSIICKLTFALATLFTLFIFTVQVVFTITNALYLIYNFLVGYYLFEGTVDRHSRLGTMAAMSVDYNFGSTITKVRNQIIVT
jgi:hypothetical protein